MKKLLLIFLTIFSFLTDAFAQQGWSNLPSCPSTFRYDDIYFFNQDTGIAVSESNFAVKTTDGGLTWKTIPTANYGRSMKFINHQIGFIGTLDENAPFLKTENGGESWFPVDSLLSDSIEGICGLSVADHQTIYGVGPFYGQAYLIKSVDTGRTWTVKNMKDYVHGLVDVKFFNADTGFITGSLESYTSTDKAVILSTFDGGETWTERTRVDIGMWDQVWKIDFP